ncbi:MAG: hypothetical protein ACRCZI_04395 [Cetobacterium sp.]
MDDMARDHYHRRMIEVMEKKKIIDDEIESIKMVIIEDDEKRASKFLGCNSLSMESLHAKEPDAVTSNLSCKTTNKRFRIGTIVKVTTGKYAGHTGMVVSRWNKGRPQIAKQTTWNVLLFSNNKVIRRMQKTLVTGVTCGLKWCKKNRRPCGPSIKSNPLLPCPHQPCSFSPLHFNQSINLIISSSNFIITFPHSHIPKLLPTLPNSRSYTGSGSGEIQPHQIPTHQILHTRFCIQDSTKYPPSQSWMCNLVYPIQSWILTSVSSCILSLDPIQLVTPDDTC